MISRGSVCFFISCYETGGLILKPVSVGLFFGTALTEKGAGASLPPGGGKSPGSPTDLLIPKWEARCCCRWGWGFLLPVWSPLEPWWAAALFWMMEKALTLLALF